MSASDESCWLTSRAVAAALGVSDRHARRWIAERQRTERRGRDVVVHIGELVTYLRAGGAESPLDRQRRLTADRIELELQARRGELIDHEAWQRLYGVAMSRGLARLANQLRKFGPVAVAAVGTLIEEVASEIGNDADSDRARGAAAVPAPGAGSVVGARDDSVGKDSRGTGGKRKAGGAGRARRRDKSAAGTAGRGY